MIRYLSEAPKSPRGERRPRTYKTKRRSCRSNFCPKYPNIELVESRHNLDPNTRGRWSRPGLTRTRLTSYALAITSWPNLGSAYRYPSGRWIVLADDNQGARESADCVRSHVHKPNREVATYCPPTMPLYHERQPAKPVVGSASSIYSSFGSCQIAESRELSYSCPTSTRRQHPHAYQPLAARGLGQPCRTNARLA